MSDLSEAPQDVDVERRDERRVLAGAVAQTLSSDLLARVAVLVTSLVAARTLSPSLFGEFLAWLATAVMASVFWDAGVSVLVQREVASGRIHVRSALTQGLYLRVLALPVWAAAFALGAFVAAGAFGFEAPTVVLFACGSLAAGLRVLPTAILRARFRFLAAGATLATGRWVTAALSPLAFALSDELERFHLIAAASVVGELLALIGAAIIVARMRVPESAPDGPAAEAISLRGSLPFGANAVMTQAYNRLDILLVATLTTVPQLAAYAPASRIQDALYLFPAALGAVGLSVLARARSQPGGVETMRRLVGMLLVGGLAIVIPLSAAVALFAPTVVRIALGSDYMESIVAVQILTWSIVAAAVVAPMLAALAAADRAVDTTKVYGATLVTAIVLHLSLDWWAGATGAAVASLGRDVAGVLAAWTLASRAGVLPSSLDLRRRSRRARVETESMRST